MAKTTFMAVREGKNNAASEFETALEPAALGAVTYSSYYGME